MPADGAHTHPGASLGVLNQNQSHDFVWLFKIASGNKHFGLCDRNCHNYSVLVAKAAIVSMYMNGCG